jgi:hypothetical protein
MVFVSFFLIFFFMCVLVLVPRRRYWKYSPDVEGDGSGEGKHVGQAQEFGHCFACEKT